MGAHVTEAVCPNSTVQPLRLHSKAPRHVFMHGSRLEWIRGHDECSKRFKHATITLSALAGGGRQPQGCRAGASPRLRWPPNPVCPPPLAPARPRFRVLRFHCQALFGFASSDHLQLYQYYRVSPCLTRSPAVSAERGHAADSGVLGTGFARRIRLPRASSAPANTPPAQCTDPVKLCEPAPIRLARPL